MSTARRITVVLTLVTVAATMTVAGTASADPPSDKGNPSCFGQFARSDAGLPGNVGGPGFVVGDVASALGKAGATDDVASNVLQELQDARQEAC